MTCVPLQQTSESEPHSKIDRVLTGFIDQLLSQRRRSALQGPRGGAIISDPITVDKILRMPQQFRKIFRLLEAVGHSRFSTNGAEWEWRRDLTQPYYFRAANSQNREKVAEVYRRRLAACKSTDPGAITRAFLAASTEIFHNALGCTVAIDSMVNFLDRARVVLKELQYFSLIPASPAERTALEEKGRVLLKCYIHEIENSPGLTELLRQFQLQAKTENFVAAEELLMNFFAAVESTADTLSIAVDRLGLHQDIQESLAAEVITNRTFPQLDCFINETLRYYPSIPFIVREATSEVEIERLRFKTGSVVIISVIGVHHHPDYWHDPDRFDPSRSEFTKNSYDRRAFIPFASGPRSCGGAKLARLELAEGLKAFIEHFTVKRRGSEISFDYAMAMRPKSWERVQMTRRR
jgi:cytochrome P450